MTVFRKSALLSNHSLLKLTLVHAAFVDSYPIHDKSGKLPANRLLFVRGGDAAGRSRIHDPADGRTYPMRAGHLYFIPCNRPVDLDLAPDLHFLSLQFRLDLIYGFDALEACPHCAEFHVPELVDELDGLLANEAELPTLLRINEIIFGLCVRLLPSDGKALRERLAQGREFRKALDFVRREADATTTVRTLAALSGMRQDVFSRRFARSLGLPPKEFLSDAIARKASELLLVPGNSAKDVARVLNFSSQYYFSHFFRRRTGHAPLQFQRLNGVK